MGRHWPYRRTFSKSANVTRLVNDSVSRFGKVDVLVNNAGVGRQQRLDQITEADWDDLIRVNLTSVFLMTQAVLLGMRSRRWGRIINLSSVAAQTGGVIGPHYAASKAGMIGLTHSLRLPAGEGGRDGECHRPRPHRNGHGQGLPRERR